MPLVPEIAIHVADESVSIWQKTEEELGEMGLPPPFWAFAWAGGQALARYVLDHAESVAGKTVLDLASGKYDALSGNYYELTDDLDEALAKAPA